MGVNHLRKHASATQSGAYAGNIHNSPHSQQTSSGANFKRPASTSGTRQVPHVSAVDSFDNKSVHPGNSVSQPPKGSENGGRAGAKSGQAHIGERSGNKKGMSGGRLG